MKKIFTLLTLFIVANVFGQSKAESEILSLSKEKFRWQVEAKVDSLANLFDNNVAIIQASGAIKSKKEYLDDVKNGTPVFNSIEIKEASARIFSKTAIVIGKGLFTITKDATEVTYNVMYSEVYVLQNKKWKLVSRHSSHI